MVRAGVVGMLVAGVAVVALVSGVALVPMRAGPVRGRSVVGAGDRDAGPRCVDVVKLQGRLGPPLGVGPVVELRFDQRSVGLIIRPACVSF